LAPLRLPLDFLLLPPLAAIAISFC
jgi:hypothetical protein